MEFYATCPAGFEHALARELRALGIERVRPLTGRVNFEGAAEAGLRACLWSRLASRVHVVLGRVACASANALYEGARELPWETLLKSGMSIACTAQGTNAQLGNTHFSALRLKDALCDRLLEKTGSRPNVETERPDARISLAIHGERASISLDLAGEPLFKRLPRAVVSCLASARQHPHVLRPDYAALVLAEASWLAEGTQPVLVDAACAGGGLLLEAIQQLHDIAPGLPRSRWGFFAWGAYEEDTWRTLRAEANERARAHEHRGAALVATDADSGVRGRAQAMLEAAGWAGQFTFCGPDRQAVLTALRKRGVSRAEAGAIVLDLTETAPARLPLSLTLSRDLVALDELAALPLLALGQADALEIALKRPPTRTATVKPDNRPATLAVFSSAIDAASDTPERPTVDVGQGKPVPVLIAESEQFARRLLKVARERRKWAKRENVTCYRVYDADLPDYAVAIDLYQGAQATPGRWLVIAEYAAPKSVDPARAQARMLDVLAIAPRVLDVDPAHVHARVRTRSRGGSQYGRRTETAHETDLTRQLPQIEEGGLRFYVNLDDYLDTGIFLDHRLTRALVRDHALNARSFLNLFAYTGTATCYAAHAGVEETCTVDLSNTYLEWAKRNMKLNRMLGNRDEFVRADVMSWIAQERHGRRRWDLIFCDPPTFSNSAKMGRRTFDVQRDHVDLLIGISRLLTRTGEAIFSCNLRTFRPDLEALARAGVVLEDISAQTIPEDFSRNKRIHHCYIMTRTTPEAAQRALAQQANA